MRHIFGKKLKNKKGFTLAELLIVVAIIAILVAIMVPVFGSSRANAIQEKDAANVRSAYAEAVAQAMASNSGYDASNKLKVNLDTYINTEGTSDGSKVTVDDSTTVTHEKSDYKITIHTKGATIGEDVIQVDKDIDLAFKGVNAS